MSAAFFRTAFLLISICGSAYAEDASEQKTEAPSSTEQRTVSVNEEAAEKKTIADSGTDNESGAAPKTTIRNGMKFISLDRKRMVTRPLSNNQPVIIRPSSRGIHTASPKYNTDRLERTRESVRVLRNDNTDSNSVISVFEPEGSKE